MHYCLGELMLLTENTPTLLTHESTRANLPTLYKSIFKKQQWHKPYAEALMEGDTAKIPEAVNSAERAIFARFLELDATSESADESIDLQTAMDALSELKIDIAVRQGHRKSAGG